MKKLSIIIPVYFNEGSLSLLFNELLEIEKKLLSENVCLELIFVDDGSEDGSLLELIKIKEKKSKSVKIIKLSRNFGAVKASKTGMQFVTGDCFMILAADLQEPPQLILEMVDKWEAGSKFVICIRNSRKDPFLTKIFAKFYYKILRLLVNNKYPQKGFDLMLMDKVMLPYFKNSGKHIYTPLFAYSLGFKPEIIHYDRRLRVHGTSKWSFKKKLVAFFDAILGSTILPIRFMSLFGFMISGTSFIYGLFIMINALRGKISVPGYASLITFNSFMFGLIIAMLGIMGEYLWRAFNEVNKNPEVVIDEIYE